MKPEKSKAPPFVAFPKTLYDDVNAGRWTANQLKVVLVVIRYTVGHKGQAEGAYLSRRLIAEKTQLHERTVRDVMDGLVKQGVIRQIAAPKGRRPAKIAAEMDATKWGAHSPDAPPLRRGCNPENLTSHQFDGESLCGSQRAPSAGVDARTSCGSPRADSEDVEDDFLNALDSGSTGEPPLSACSDEDEVLCGELVVSKEDGRRIAADFLARHKAERWEEAMAHAVGGEA